MATFSGNGSVTVPSTVKFNGSSVSLGVWFKTTTANVPLVSQADKPVGGANPSSRYFPLYIDTAGNLRGGFYTGINGVTMVSGTAVNNGQWHFAMLTGEGGGDPDATSTARSWARRW